MAAEINSLKSKPSEQFDMNEEKVFTCLLSDTELRPLLVAKCPVRFDGLAGKCGVIDKQVADLGFGSSYNVTFTKPGAPGNWTKLTPKPGCKVNTNLSEGLSTPSLAERPPSDFGPQGVPKKYAP